MTTTPHAVDQQFISAPLLDVALLSRVPQLSEIETRLQNSFGDRLGECHIKEEGILSAELDGKNLVNVALLDGPPVDPDSAYSLHPVLTGDPSGLEDVQAQLLITLLPSNDELQQVRSSREARIAQINTHAQVTAALAALEGVEAVHNIVGNVTVSPKIFVEAVTNNDPAMYSASVWLAQTDSGITAYTIGLVQAGHPELIAENSAQDPSALFYTMCDLVNYALSSGTFKDGDTFAFSADAQPLSITSTTYPTDSSVPALRVSL